MKALHITAADHGGAGRAAQKLHLRLREAGVDSRMCVFDRRTDDHWTIQLKTPSRLFGLRRFTSKALYKVISHQDYHFQNQEITPNVSAVDLLAQVRFSPDIVIVHYLSNFLSCQDILKLQRISEAPVIWNLLDMGGFTGGCHYAWSCRRYEGPCGCCPALRFPAEADVSAGMLARKYEAMKEIELTVVAGSTFLGQQASRSTVFRQRDIHTILIGVDSETFRQRERNEARALLGLPKDKRTILFGAQSSRNRRKGSEWLVRALLELAQRGAIDPASIQLISIGDVDRSAELADAGYSQERLGPISDESRLVLAYQAADVYACPSVQDSGPMMINESMMCGTPVVAFEMGVAMDLVVEHETGYMVPLENHIDFANGLGKVLALDREASKAMSNNCRNIALDKCSSEAQARRYLDLMKKLHGRGARDNDSSTGKIKPADV